MNALQPLSAGVSSSTSEPVQRRFGPFGLKRLLGRSSLTMAWLAEDSRNAQEVFVMMPRRASVAGAQGLKRALDAARRAARVDHPRLQAPFEIGQFAGWLYIACQPRQGVQTLGDWLGAHAQGATALDVAHWGSDALEGLAAVHDAGLAHGDVGLHSLLIDRGGRVHPWGLAVVSPLTSDGAGTAADRDVMSVALLMHQALAGSPPLGEVDLPTVLARSSRERVRLPVSLPVPVPEVLAAIVDRATSSEISRRYVGARSFLRAVDGWRQSATEGKASILANLVARVRLNGHLPALPGHAAKASQAARMDSDSLHAVVDLILEEPALALELLRQLNARQSRSEMEPVISVSRAVQLVGLQGVRRAATALRPWPGVLAASQSAALQIGLLQTRQVAWIARLLAPAGLSVDMVALAAQLQQLGRLLALYHFPDEAAQMSALMQPWVRNGPAAVTEAGLDESTAARTVLGVEVAALGRAVLRHWGVGEELEMIATPLPAGPWARVPQGAQEWIRLVGSCAGEALQAWQCPGALQASELERVAGRYAKALDVTAMDLRSVAEHSYVQIQRNWQQSAP